MAWNSDDWKKLATKGLSAIMDGGGETNKTVATTQKPELQQPAGMGATYAPLAAQQAPSNSMNLNSGLGKTANIALLGFAGLLGVVLIIRLTK